MSAMCRGNKLFWIGILWFFVNVLVMILFGDMSPLIRIVWFNSTMHEELNLMAVLLVSVVANFLLFMLNAFCQPPESEVNENKNVRSDG